MGLFDGSEPSISEIDRKVATSLDSYLGSPEKVGDGRFAENFTLMLEELRSWSDAQELGLWKRSRIAGALEASLRGQLPSNVVPDLMRKVYSKLGLR